MFVDLALGPLTEPMTGRHWDRDAVRMRHRQRVGFYARRGMRRGDRVFLCYGNTPEFFVDLAAVWSLGACAIPIDTRLTAFEIDTLGRAAAPRWALWRGTPDAALAPALAAIGVSNIDASEADAEAETTALPPGSLVGLDDDALILFTSGTTGQPKGVVHTHRSLRARWLSLRQALGITAFRRTLCLLPTHFGHGLICNSLFPWLSGQHLFIGHGEALLLECVDCGAPARPARHHVHVVGADCPASALKTAKPPRTPVLERVFAARRRCRGISGRRSAAGPAREVWNSTASPRPAAGSPARRSRISPRATASSARPGAARSRSCAAPMRAHSSTARRCAAGESGHVGQHAGLMRGYLGRDDLTAEVVSAGWFRTGDIGLLDERGWLHLRGREREEINKGGMKIYPGDIDAVVEQFEHTIDVCAFALEDALLGEDVGVAVVMRNSEPATLRQRHEWTAQRLARHQMPRRRARQIPRTSRGKVNRAAVARAPSSNRRYARRRARAGQPPQPTAARRPEMSLRDELLQVIEASGARARRPRRRHFVDPPGLLDSTALFDLAPGWRSVEPGLDLTSLTSKSGHAGAPQAFIERHARAACRRRWRTISCPTGQLADQIAQLQRTDGRRSGAERVPRRNTRRTRSSTRR
jgi:long-chain acyl-CoA synthetase